MPEQIRDSRPEPKEDARPVALLLGPALGAVSGVSTHLNLLFGSPLAERYRLVHFQVGSEGRAEGPGARREGTLGRIARLLKGPFQLAAQVLRRRAALVHFNTSLNAAYWRDLPMMLAARLAGARVVCQVHGGALPQEFLGRSRLAKAWLRATLRQPDAIVVLAESELRAWREFLPDRPVTLVANGVDCASFRASRRTRGQHEPLRLLYIGRLAREKGLFEALEGVKLALAQGYDVRLTIAGSGPDTARLRAHAEVLGLGRRVCFAGPAFGRDKLLLFSTADALLLPSYAEGLPYALLEAMAAGLPPIVTPVGAIPDVVADGLHGLLVPPRNPAAIARAIGALTERRVLARLSQAAARRASVSYSIQSVAQRFAALYASLARTDGCGAGGETRRAPAAPRISTLG
jgi:glycosyltransferase involved in cell wall biosynthesis